MSILESTIRYLFLAGISFLLISSCGKKDISNTPADPLVVAGFIKYTIRAGDHYCDKNVFLQTNYNELKFLVRFDSSCIYQTAAAANQLDINKLYGFADNNSDHQQFSARIGWRWSNNALRLFAYIYNNGVVSSEELAAVNIDSEILCSIGIDPTHYIFKVNNIDKTFPRFSTTATAIGYHLYPYFGGDEAAPHDIRIWIKEI